jgi:pimeloyl-ACP methyl ester carboxylesterase
MNKLFFYSSIFLSLFLMFSSNQHISENKKLISEFIPIGNLYEIENKNMHILNGGEGDVTVIFSSGWGTTNPSADFYPLYNKIQKKSKFVVYDRFGYGYSDLTEKSRDIDIIVNEIKLGLEKSGQTPPYIFVAHSLASLEVLRYTQKYPEEIKGILFLDAGNPEEYALGINNFAGIAISFFSKEMMNLGITRLLKDNENFEKEFFSDLNDLKFLAEDLKEEYKKSYFLKANNFTIHEEMKMSKKNALKVLNDKSIFEIPITIITAVNSENNESWIKSQQKFKEWSNNSKHVMLNGEHYIHHYFPEIIIEEIINLINMN